MTALARQLTADARFQLVNGMCFETPNGADWIAGIDADWNPHVFGLFVSGEGLKIVQVVDAYPPPDVCNEDECNNSPTFGHNVYSMVRFCRKCVESSTVCVESLNPGRGGEPLPETAWLKLDDPATFGALWSLLPRAKWTLEMYAGRCGVYNSDDMNRRPGVGSSPGEAVARVLLALWERE